MAHRLRGMRSCFWFEEFAPWSESKVTTTADNKSRVECPVPQNEESYMRPQRASCNYNDSDAYVHPQPPKPTPSLGFLIVDIPAKSLHDMLAAATSHTTTALGYFDWLPL